LIGDGEIVVILLRVRCRTEKRWRHFLGLLRPSHILTLWQPQPLVHKMLRSAVAEKVSNTAAFGLGRLIANIEVPLAHVPTPVASSSQMFEEQPFAIWESRCRRV